MRPLTWLYCRPRVKAEPRLVMPVSSGNMEDISQADFIVYIIPVILLFQIRICLVECEPKNSESFRIS